MAIAESNARIITK